MHDPPADAVVPDARHKVLYIEDNAANQLLVQRVLGRRGDIQLISATRGLPGLEMARDHQPAVVLLDIHLPDINGDRVLKRLRDDPLTCAIPVVVLSGDASARQIQRLLDAGAAGYLTKPLDIHKLLDTVDEIIRKRNPAKGE